MEFSTFIWVAVGLVIAFKILEDNIERLPNTIINILVIPLLVFALGVGSLIVVSMTYWIVFHFDKLAKIHYFIQGL